MNKPIKHLINLCFFFDMGKFFLKRDVMLTLDCLEEVEVELESWIDNKSGSFAIQGTPRI